MRKNKNNKLVIFLVIVVLVVVVAVIFKVKGNNDENSLATNNMNLQGPIVMDNPSQNSEEEKEEFVQVNADGTKVNISTELNKTKIFEGLEITNIKLTEKDNVSLLSATVKNSTSSTLGGIPVTVTFVNKEGKQIAMLGGYIANVKPGSTVELNVSSTGDFANAYDFKLTK